MIIAKDDIELFRMYSIINVPPGAHFYNICGKISKERLKFNYMSAYCFILNDYVFDA